MPNRPSDRAGIDRRELFAMMAGEYNADLEWLSKLAEVLEVHVGELLVDHSSKLN